MVEHVERIPTVRFIESGILIAIRNNTRLSGFVNYDTIVATFEIVSIICDNLILRTLTVQPIFTL